MRELIVQLRQRIRYHRDQRGDDRCWLDDNYIYEALANAAPITLPSREVFMTKCRVFHEKRQAGPAPLVTLGTGNSPDGEPDSDLQKKNLAQLANELKKLLYGVREHKDIPDEQRTAADDAKLYALLPEGGSAAVTTLPEQPVFLASCERFFASRDPKHLKLHQW